MLTRRQFALILEDKELEQGARTIYQSSILAVAREYLGELDEEELKYSRTRGGVLFYSKGESLTAREILELLPEQP